MSDMSEQLAAAANSTVRQYKSALAKRGPKVVMPGGIAHDASPYLAQVYKFKEVASIFNAPEKHLKHPDPGYHYAWAEFHVGGSRPREGAMRTEAFLRKGHYIAVLPTEMLETSDIPYSKGVTGKRVEMYDVMLVKVPPKAWEELYEVREALGVSNVTRHFERFYEEAGSAGATDVGVEAEVTKP